MYFILFGCDLRVGTTDGATRRALQTRLAAMLGQPLMSGRPARADHASGAPSSRRLAIPAFAAAAALLSSGI